MKKKIAKALCISSIVIASFSSGLYFAEDVKETRSIFNYSVEEGFYPRPYNLRIINKQVNGKIQSYLVDTSTEEAHKIGENMYVGDGKHRLNSVLEFPKSYIEKTRTIMLPFDIYNLIKPY